MKSRISAKEAAYVARESLKRRAIRLLAPEGGEQPAGALVPSELSEDARQAPPRVLKPSPLNDQCVAPTPDLESHRKRLREAFGNTMSDEFAVGRARCRMHGGARGSGGPRGKRNGNFRHGGDSRERELARGEPRFGRSGASCGRSVPAQSRPGRS